MTDPLTIKLKTLTPLWTGGADGKSDRLRITGIIGSLRWWYEAIVRGMGGYACDPVGGDRCEFDVKDKRAPKEQLCPACWLFGCTGWARRFRLVVRDTTQPDGPTGAQCPTGNRFRRNSTNEKPAWYFSNGPGRSGTITMSVIPLAADFDPNVILGLFKLIERYAGLAAKTQLGYGWIQLEEPPALDLTAFVRASNTSAATRSGESKGLPSLKEMFFTQVKTSDPGLTATLNLKYDLRAAFREAFNGNRTLRHFVCGTVEGEKQASKISISQAVNRSMRVWGWIPDTLPKGVARNQVVDQIKVTLGKFGTLHSWREYNSTRDSMTPSQTDIAVFLTNLLQEGERQ
ncbi:MAG TPA: type III-B CRISPR module RAMP protein Cmr1 [Candidatus Acetothermia bacterium]|nr:type III-B CRISPR module RAMP protein Cmr1 [Candidatus Acetothermia bacterium]